MQAELPAAVSPLYKEDSGVSRLLNYLIRCSGESSDRDEREGEAGSSTALEEGFRPRIPIPFQKKAP